MRTALRFVRHTPCLTLLVVQLLGVLTMRALRATPFFSWFSALVFVPAVALLVASAVVGSDTLLAVSAAFESVLYDPRGWMELLFLSFTTLSSTGLSDIVPVTGHARSVILLEQLAGIFYIAMVVTRLVALRAHRERPSA